MVARESTGSHDIVDHSSSHLNTNGGKRNQYRNNNRNNNGGRGGNKGGSDGGGKAGGGGQMGDGNSRGDGQQPAGQQSPPNSPWAGGQSWPWMAPWAPWAIPPCPYPSNSWTRPNYGQQLKQQPGLLGPRPQQAYTAAPSPTDIEAAMHTLGITPPNANWYMNTGATSHMTSTQGNLTSYFNKRNKCGIIVGNGQSIPIHGYGHTKLSSPCPPLQFINNVLHAPHLVKNLVSVRKFTTDNSVFVEFDPCGFTVKDFQTGRPVMRCESRGELYPITTPTTSPSSFAVLAPSLWHDRLGHPRRPVLNSLRKNN
ncbi:putative uncharacterized protein DDB_G0284695 [Solanum tuberosum]|uniref:putative uncharacterized protein DDB_G0284695 n=1 Tax=Solanum tuberosum TaxID=4113 RepID=UPI00073A1D55|nr:PREDICTED: putative uncharacterized protein DDB_G0284695 [Solanum tuberosum]